MSGTLRLRGATSGYSELQAPAVAADQTFILPTAGGTLLTTDSPVPKLTLELGSASQPSLTFEGDTDTGLYSSGTNTLNLVTGGSSRLTINSDGSVVLSSSLTSTSGSIAAQQFIANSAGTAGSPAYRFGLGSGLFSPSGTDHVAISTGSTERLRIDSSGNVGLGTNSPTPVLPSARSLTVANIAGHAEINFLSSSANFSSIYFGDSTTGADRYSGYLEYSHPNDFMRFGTGTVERLRIDSSGNVGIGTVSPSYRLQLGNHTSTSTATPEVLSLGGTFSSVAGSNPKLRIYDETTTSYMGIGVSSGQMDYSATGSFDQVFFTGGTERLRLDNLGNVGIGGTPLNYTNYTTATINGSSGGALEFTTNGTTDGLIYGNGSGQTFLIQAQANRHLLFYANAQEVMRCTTNGNVGIGIINPYVAAWGSGARQVHVSGADYGVLHLSSTTYGSTWSHGAGGSAQNNFMAYDGSNHWLTISPTSGITKMPGVYNSTTSNAGNVHVNSLGQLYRSTSSIKYKTDVEPLENQYADAILNCRPVWYRSVCDGDIVDKSRNKSEFGYYGFIAEEVADIDPRLVSWKTKKDVKNDDNWEVNEVDLDPSEYEAEGVNYTNFVPLLLNLIKRQKTELETLKEKIEALENV